MSENQKGEDKMKAVLKQLNYNGPLFYRLEYAVMAEEKGIPVRASNLLAKVIDYLYKLTGIKSDNPEDWLHSPECPHHTDNLKILAQLGEEQETCCCLPKYGTNIRWMVSYFLARIAHKTLIKSPSVYSDLRIYCGQIIKRLALEKVKMNSKAIIILTETISLLEPFYNEMCLLHASDQYHGIIG